MQTRDGGLEPWAEERIPLDAADALEQRAVQERVAGDVDRVAGAEEDVVDDALAPVVELSPDAGRRSPSAARRRSCRT